MRHWVKWWNNIETKIQDKTSLILAQIPKIWIEKKYNFIFVLPFSLISVPRSLRCRANESRRPFVFAGSGCKCAHSFDNASEVMAYGRGRTLNTHRIFFLHASRLLSQWARCRHPVADGSMSKIRRRLFIICILGNTQFLFFNREATSHSIFCRLKLELRYGHNRLWAESWKIAKTRTQRKQSFRLFLLRIHVQTRVTNIVISTKI